MQRRPSFTTLAALVPLSAASFGCSSRVLVDLPPPGVPGPVSFIVQEETTGPITIIFPGRSAPTDDVTLGIRETALAVAEKAGGSVALFSWKVYDAAKEWAAREAGLRRGRGESARIALVGHSWGGQAAGRFAREALDEGVADEIPVLVTVDAIDKGYLKNSLQWFTAAALEGISGRRLPIMAFGRTPVPGDLRLLRHVNYYQLDSAMLHAWPIATATENHEVWFSHGKELGHGNLDNFIVDIVAEDVRRAFLAGGGRTPGGPAGSKTLSGRRGPAEGEEK